MSNLINDFFDFSIPCSIKIPNCQQLRDDYQREIDKAQQANCKSCALSQIKVKYMELVWTAYMSAIG